MYIFGFQLDGPITGGAYKRGGGGGGGGGGGAYNRNFTVYISWLEVNLMNY